MDWLDSEWHVPGSWELLPIILPPVSSVNLIVERPEIDRADIVRLDHQNIKHLRYRAALASGPPFPLLVVDFSLFARRCKGLWCVRLVPSLAAEEFGEYRAQV